MGKRAKTPKLLGFSAPRPQLKLKILQKFKNFQK